MCTRHPVSEEAGVPRAKSAAISRVKQGTEQLAAPNHRLIRGDLLVRRVRHSAVAIVVGVTVFASGATVTAPTVAAAGGCNSWSSTTRPPDYIRVLRNGSGRVERVPFRQYVVTVMGKEWPSYLPQQVIEAGAIAVKQYAWFHALGGGRMSSRGQCFDVTDGVGDQLYKPGRSRVTPDHYAAINATWGIRLLKNGQLFMTGYRTGFGANCGRDATGWKLYARSATKCAKRGMRYQQILRTYYGPDLAIVDGGSSGPAVAVQQQAPATNANSASHASNARSTQPAPPSMGDQSSTHGSDATPPTNPSYLSPDSACAGADDGVGAAPASQPVGERAFSMV